MLSFTLTSSLLVNLLGASTATTVWPTPILTTNTSLVQRGHPFTATCQMTHFVAPNEAYLVRFWRNTSADSYNGILEYAFPAASSGGTRKPTQINWSNSFISVRSLVYNLTMATVEITSHIPGNVYIKCNNPGHFSAPVGVKVVESLPTATFSFNTQAFTATCAIGNFNATTSPNYTVSFYSKRDGRLATYETVQGTSVLLIEKHAQSVVHHGPRTRFPVFDLKLVESQNVSKAEYWCQLEAPNLGKFESKHWVQNPVQDPVVSFTSKAPNSTTRLGTCSVDNFNPAGKEYSVQFWTDLGPKTVNRLATYAVKPERMRSF